MSTKPETPEAVARNRYGRQIDEAFEEASKLAGSALPPTEFYTQFLNRTLSAIEATAGVVWLRTPQGFLQIACQVNLDKVGLDAKRGGRQCHNEILRQVFQSNPPRPVLVEPQGRLTGMAAEAGAVPAANLTDHYALFAPIIAQDKQSLGLLEVFQEPSHDARLYQTFLQYTVQMAGYASQYHSYTGLRQSAGLEKLFSQIESFAKLIHGSLNPTEVAYHVANEGRRLVECDRLCVGVRHARKVTVEAVSGADVVEKASTHVRRMKNLFDAVLAFGDKLVYKGTKDEGLPPDLSHALDAYLAESQPKLLVVAPIRDEREKDDTRAARAVLLMESFNPPENTDALVQRLEVVGKHAAPALYNAVEVKRIPFGFLWRPLAKLQDGLGGKTRFIVLASAIGLAALLAAMVLVPYPLKMQAKGQLQPVEVKFVFAPYPGEVRDIVIKPGADVAPNGVVARLFNGELQTEILQLERELRKAERELEGLNALKSKGGLTSDEQIKLETEIAKSDAALKATQALLQQKREMYHLDRDFQRLGTFPAVAPGFEDTRYVGLKDAKWKVLSSDNRNELLRKTVRPNEPLARLGYTDGPWRIEMKIPEGNIGHVEQAFITEGKYKTDAAGKKYLDVDVLLTAAPDASYLGRLYQTDIAAEAVPNKDDHNETESVVLAYVRVNLDDIPAEKHLPANLFIAGQEVHARVRCGDHALGYSLFHGVYEWFYEKVIFFF